MVDKALTGEVMTGPLAKPAALAKLVKDMMDTEMSEKTDPELALQAVEGVCVAMSRINRQQGTLRVILGQMVSGVKRYQLYKPKFQSFNEYRDYIQEKYQLGDTSIKNAVQFVRDVPQLKAEDAGDMPISNMTVLARAVKKAEPRQRAQLIRDAREMPAVNFEEKMKSKGLIGVKGRPEGGSRSTGIVTLAITVSARSAQQFRTLAKDHGGPSKYLLYLMALDRKSAAA